MDEELERERGSQDTNDNRVAAIGLHRIKQHQYTGSEADVIR